MKALPGIAGLSLFISIAVACSAQSPRENSAPLDNALQLYAELSGKTVLRSPTLPPLAEFAQPPEISDTDSARHAVESELVKHGIQLIPLREAFTLAVEEGWTNSPNAQRLATIQPRPTDDSLSASVVPSPQDKIPGKEPLSPGTIDFKGADLRQCLDLYSMLIHRTLLVGNQLNGSNFRFRTQTALTKSGAIYLLEVALVLNGIGVADDGTNFVQVVPLSRLAYLKLQAPERDPAEPLLDPGSIKRIGFLTPFKPARPGQMGPRGTIDELVAYYAELTDRTAVSFPQFGSVSITFSAQTPLTKRELLYAIETTLALNGVSIVEVDDKTIKAAHIPQRDRAEKKSDEL